MTQTSKNSNPVLFLLIGLLLVAGGIVMFVLGQNFKESAVETTAQILDITPKGSSEDSYDVTICFTTQDGTQITTLLGSYSSSMEKGDLITVYYDPADPYTLASASSGSIAFVLVGVGLAVACFGGYSMIKTKKQEAVQ